MSRDAEAAPGSMTSVFACVLMRDLKLASRRRIDALLPLAFFIVAISLFPLGVGPEPGQLHVFASGVGSRCCSPKHTEGLPRCLNRLP